MRIKGLSKFSTPAPGVYDPLVCLILYLWNVCLWPQHRKERRRQRVGRQVTPLDCGLIEAGRKVQHQMPTVWKLTSLGGNSTFRTFSDLLISTSIRTDGPAFSLAPRMKAEKVYVTPAPSTYDMRKPEVVRVRAPAYSLAGRFLIHFLSDRSNTLGSQVFSSTYRLEQI